MKLAVAIQMDPVETINIDTDSTFALALEAQARGHRLYHYMTRHLSLIDGRVVAQARRLTVRRTAGQFARLGPYERLDLATMDVILMRQDPPFDMAYITATHVLEHVQRQGAGGERSGKRAERTRKALRHAFRRADAADARSPATGRRSSRFAKSIAISS